MIGFIKGDILLAQTQAIVNPVNTVGVMGKGLALAFKNKYPNMYETYKHMRIDKKFNIGTLYIYKTDSIPEYIINLPTKTEFRLPSRLDYIEQGVYKLAQYIRHKNIRSITIPALGCGCGKLRWTDVQEILITILQPLTDVDIQIILPHKEN
jgi:O-acetyl-ADP-ribose deacetylase (regulator of RNase III)